MPEVQHIKSEYIVNSAVYQQGEIAEVAITDTCSDRYVAITMDEKISYRPLTPEEIAAKAVRLEVFCDMTVKFYRYGFFIDDCCVMAGDTELQRIVLSDFLSDNCGEYYCFGYDAEINRLGCMCATNDVWKIYHDRYVYTGYYQIAVRFTENKAVIMQNNEIAYQAAAIPIGASFPVCDALHPQPIEPSVQGYRVREGVYYVKKGTKFTDGSSSFEIKGNCTLYF